MTMKKVFQNRIFLLLAALLSCNYIAEVTSKVEGSCQLVFGVGCPDLQKCAEVCSLCSLGEGRVTPICTFATGRGPECICLYSQTTGASPCNGHVSPRCPQAQLLNDESSKPSSSSPADQTASTMTAVNGHG